MATRMYIDGIDVLTSYGAYPTELGGFLEWPSLKEVKTYDWPDEDGVDADLTHPVLASRQFMISIAVKNGLISRFVDFICGQSTRIYEIPELNYTKQLRMVGCSDFNTMGDMGFVNITLSDDSPFSGYEYHKPSTNTHSPNSEGVLTIDGIDITSYGCVALQGVADSMKAFERVKEALAINVSNIAGVRYDNDSPVYNAPHSIVIPLLMRAGSINEFWQNYYALIYDLTRPRDREIVYKGGIFHSVFYNSQSIEEISMPRYNGDSIWVKFTITFTTFASSFILSSEDSEAIVDENNEYYIKL